MLLASEWENFTSKASGIRFQNAKALSEIASLFSDDSLSVVKSQVSPQSFPLSQLSLPVWLHPPCGPLRR